MITLKKRETERETLRNSDEFEKYLKEQRSKTTCNGMELAPFSWYMKALGLS
ncbi:MAG: hypothetical protein WCK67_04095 [bacterium]